MGRHLSGYGTYLLIYDNLAEFYEEEDLDDVAMEAYRKAYQILKGGVEQIYPLRGMARVFFVAK